MAYFSFGMTRLFKYYNKEDRTGDILIDLNIEIGYFIGVMMLACSLMIIATYSSMHMTFKETKNLQSSNYR